MAITFVTGNASSLDSTGTISSHVVTSGTDRVLILFSAEGGDTTPQSITGVTWNTSENFTKLGRAAVSAGIDNDYCAEIWYLVNPTATTANCVITLDGASGAREYYLLEANGVNQTTPFRDFTTAFQNTEDTTITATLSSAVGDVVVDAAACGAHRTKTVGASQTQLFNATGAYSTSNRPELGVSWEAGAASVTMSWSLNNANRWATVLGSLQPSAASAGQVVISASSDIQ